MTLFTRIATAAAAMTPALAMAHDDHESTNLVAGLLHFISSPDHLATIVVVAGVAGYLVTKARKA